MTKAEKATVYDLNGDLCEIAHALPYFVGLWSPEKGIQEVFYASASENNKFKTSVGTWYLPQDIKYTTLDDLYLNSAAAEGDREAFKHLLNVQSVALRAIADAKEMLVQKAIHKGEYVYVHDILVKLIRKSHDVLAMHKKILEQEGLDVSKLTTNTKMHSRYSQKARLANGMIHLIQTGVLYRGDNTSKRADKTV